MKKIYVLVDDGYEELEGILAKSLQEIIEKKSLKKEDTVFQNENFFYKIEDILEDEIFLAQIKRKED